MIKPFILIAVMLLIPALAILPTSSAQASQPSQHVLSYSTYGSSNEELYVPVNSTGLNVYPDWNIYLYGSGSFTFEVNGTVEETGVSLGSFNFSYVWNLPGGSNALASLIFGSTTYTFDDIITGPLSNRVIVNVQVSSSMPGRSNSSQLRQEHPVRLCIPTGRCQCNPQPTLLLRYMRILRKLSQEVFTGLKQSISMYQVVLLLSQLELGLLSSNFPMS